MAFDGFRGLNNRFQATVSGPEIPASQESFSVLRRCQDLVFVLLVISGRCPAPIGNSAAYLFFPVLVLVSNEMIKRVLVLRKDEATFL